MQNSIERKGDFLTTFFLENRAVTRMLSEILKDQDNMLSKELSELPDDFVFPFFKREGVSAGYVIRQELNYNYTAVLNGQPCDEHVIQNGDYFVFKNKRDNKSIRVLFVAAEAIRIGYKKYRISKNMNIFIGRMPINQISFNLNNFISREKHAAIRIDSNGNAFVEDLKRSIGVYVNNKLVHSQQLQMFDEVFIMGLSIIYMGEFIAVRSMEMECTLPEMTEFSVKIPTDPKNGNLYFVSSPRIMKSLDNDEIEIDAPPAPFTPDKTPAVLVIGPSLTMSLVMLVSLGVSISNAVTGGEMTTIITSSVMAGGMLLGSFMWPMLLRRYQRKRTLEEESHRRIKYTEYISDIEKILIAKKERTERILDQSLNPSPDILCSMFDSEANKLRLWERSYEDEDFLSVRLGRGNRLFEVRLKIPKKGFHLYEDEMRELPDDLAEKYSVLTNVPLTMDLKNNHAIGIIGSRKNICSLLEEIILNIIALHSCEEAKIAVITSQKDVYNLKNFKNVPHIWSCDKSVRFYATNQDETHYICSIIDEAIGERIETRDRECAEIPHYILIITEPELVEKEALLRYVENQDKQYGITAIFAYGDVTKLPKSCKAIIQSDDNRTGYYIKNKNKNKFISFTSDIVERSRISEFTNKLSRMPVKKNARTAGIVEQISFLQMYKAGNIDELDIERHWDSNNSDKSLAAPIGVMPGGEVFSLDIHESYHGCHGLVAGTTGSGKSEFLQSFILSLAINYSPEEIAFVLVDFKGGDMARPFMKKPFSPALPHLSATISNLSGNILYRALVSLEAEIRSRQRIFNESAAALGIDKLDINSYHKYYKGGRLDTPLPHLVIIIDEFAQLKTQHPEFLAQLINVAQVGRSLGIHLILATQKPGGIVDPQIMSNSRFRVCLKVADKQDSIDMINRPDAAKIKSPGRLYLQVGYDEIYKCIQSGYSGADYIPLKTYVPEEEITVEMTDNTARPIHSAKLDIAGAKTGKTQLEAVVAEIIAVGQKRNLWVKPLWLDVLPEKIILGSLQMGRKGFCSAVLGMADYVCIQEQKTLTIDFSKNGHVAIYGASGMGKTTLLQTLIYSMVMGYGYTPEELNLYAMDFGGRNLGYLEELPHTGGVVFADDENGLTELAAILQNIIEERKRIFASNNCGTFEDYRTVSGNPLPAVLVLIDNFAPFREKYMDVSDQFIDIISSGRTFGVYFVITGTTRNSIYYKVTEHIATYFTLKMNDPGNYFDIHNMRPPIIPEDISGRGITVINREIVEFQTALAIEGENEADRISEISREYGNLAKSWNGFMPAKLNEQTGNYGNNTDVISVSGYSATLTSNPPESIEEEKENLILGMSRSGVLRYGITLSEDYRVCICAENEGDLALYYQKLIKSIIQYSGRNLVFIDDDRETFKTVTETYPSCTYIRGRDSLDLFIEELKPELNNRLETPDEVHEELFIIIAEFNNFFKMISDEQAAFLRKVFRYIDSPQYKICFICGFDVRGEKNNDRLYMSLVVNAENYLICPGCYEQAVSKIETLPTIPDIKSHNAYFCLKEKNIEIRW